MHYERRSETVDKARWLREAAEMHQRIYQAIRSRNPVEARAAMHEHIAKAEQQFKAESIAQQQTEITTGERS